MPMMMMVRAVRMVVQDHYPDYSIYQGVDTLVWRFLLLRAGCSAGGVFARFINRRKESCSVRAAVGPLNSDDDELFAYIIFHIVVGSGLGAKKQH